MAQALHPLGRLCLDLLLAFSPSMVMDVVVMDVLGRLSGDEGLGRHVSVHRARLRLGAGTSPRQGALFRRAGAWGMPQHSWRLTARGLENSGKVLVQDGLRVLLTRARGEQRQRVACTASRHLRFIPLLLLKHTQECNVTKKFLQTAYLPKIFCKCYAYKNMFL